MAQSPTRSEVVHAGAATIVVTIVGQGEPVVFIPSRGRSVADFADLSTRLVQAGYQAILPEPRGIGSSTWAGGSAPMLVVQGTEDIVAVPENAKRLATEYPSRVTLVEIPHAGHALLPEQPEHVANAVLAYLQSNG